PRRTVRGNADAGGGSGDVLPDRALRLPNEDVVRRRATEDPDRCVVRGCDHRRPEAVSGSAGMAHATGHLWPRRACHIPVVELSERVGDVGLAVRGDRNVPRPAHLILIPGSPVAVILPDGTVARCTGV